MGIRFLGTGGGGAVAGEKLPPTGGTLPAFNLFNGTVAGNYVYDPEIDQVASSSNCLGGILGSNGKVYLSPRNINIGSSVIREYSPLTHTITNKASFWDNPSWRMPIQGGARGTEGKIAYVPNTSTRAFVYDYLSDYISPVMSVSSSETWNGAVGVGGLVYGIPLKSNRLLIINTANATRTYSAPIPGILVTATGNFWGGIPDHRHNGVWLVPYGSTSLWFYSISGDAWTEVLSGLPAGNKWKGGVLGPDGCLYFMPSGTPNVLKVDLTNFASLSTVTDALFACGVTGSNLFSNGVCGVDGNVYGVPYSSHSPIRITPDSATGPKSQAIPYMALDFSSSKLNGGVLLPNGDILLTGYNQPSRRLRWIPEPTLWSLDRG